MVSRDTCFLTLAIVSAFLVVSMDARSWDMAVAIGHEIDFFNRIGTRVGNVVVANTVALTALAYDSANHTMYMSDSNNANVSMYSTHLTEGDLTPQPVLNRKDTERILAMAFDPVDKTLYWVDSKLEAIMKMEVHSSNGINSPKILHNLKGHSPYGIALDICHRFIYWTNSNSTVHSIERSKLDGTDRREIVNDTRYEVYALAIDHASGKLYFSDYGTHYTIAYYTIEEINLDGSGRRVLVNDTGHRPLYMAVDDRAVYWTDALGYSVWKMERNSNTEKPIKLIKSYATHGSEIMSIVTRDNVGDIDCKAIKESEQSRAKNPPITVPPVTSFSNLTTSAEDMSPNESEQKNSSDNGRDVESTADRNCTKGSTDPHCGTSACLNFCIHGECSLDAKGSPQCKCGTKYTGERCEKDICDGYCLNNGSCSVIDERPTCKCADNSRGSRCQYTVEIDKLCAIYCMGTDGMMNNFSTAICPCSELNETLPESYDESESLISSTILLSVLIALIAALVIVVGVLSYHVNKLRRRPRIRKRFVVSKGGVTPLTARPQLPADSCEITIENCCNMNICETPCFEPKLRATPTKSKKGEEKNSLLDSMEGADSC